MKDIYAAFANRDSNRNKKQRFCQLQWVQMKKVECSKAEFEKCFKGSNVRCWWGGTHKTKRRRNKPKDTVLGIYEKIRKLKIEEALQNIFIQEKTLLFRGTEQDWLPPLTLPPAECGSSIHQSILLMAVDLIFESLIIPLGSHTIRVVFQSFPSFWLFSTIWVVFLSCTSFTN